jgi:glycosyltransferase involved in cell wall biosynthesis
MNILFVNQNAGFFGGVEQNIFQVASALEQRGHRVFLVFFQRTEKGFDKFCSPFTKVIQITEKDRAAEQVHNMVTSCAIDSIYLHKVQRVMDVLSVDLSCHKVAMVHDHDLYCPRRHRYKVITHRTCSQKMGWRCLLDFGFLRRDRNAILGLKVQSISNKIKELKRYSRLDRILVGSHYMRQQLELNGVDRQLISLAPPVVRASAIEYSAPASFSELLFVGQLVRGKGVDLLLKAVARVDRDLRVKIIGKGNAEPELRSLARRLGVSEMVEFVGWVSPEELSKHYAQASFVVVPSRWPEPFGMVGLEAMRNGRAVVAFDVGGIGDWLEDGHTGVLVSGASVSALTEELTRLLDNPELTAEMGRNAYQSVQERFCFDQYIKQIESVLSPLRSKQSATV